MYILVIVEKARMSFIQLSPFANANFITYYSYILDWFIMSHCCCSNFLDYEEVEELLSKVDSTTFGMTYNIALDNFVIEET